MSDHSSTAEVMPTAPTFRTVWEARCNREESWHETEDGAVSEARYWLENGGTTVQVLWVTEQVRWQVEDGELVNVADRELRHVTVDE